MVPREAVIVLDPVLDPLANPALVTPDYGGLRRTPTHGTGQSRVLLSLYSPVAMNCWF